MTNKEKAYQLFNELSHKCDSLHYGHTVDTLTKMAKWKDKQYSEIIKEECNTSYESGLAEGERKAEARFKKFIELHKQPVLASETDDTVVGYSIDIDMIFNELFKEE